jgi:DtxR family transcriptional regulator, Mn-dependent transcriptional regulator
MIQKQKIEEILEAIWKAEEKQESSLAHIRAICPEPISDEEIVELQDAGFVRREGERILFTEEGKGRARGVVRRHRLTESLLVHVLQLPRDQAHQIACDMEHILPPEMEESICTLLGHPEVTADGRPIPSGPDCLRKQRAVSSMIVNLCELHAGEKGRIAYIKPKNHERIHRLTSFGLVPGVTIELHQKTPAYCLRFEGTELALDSDVAEDIFVGRINNEEPA